MSLPSVTLPIPADEAGTAVGCTAGRYGLTAGQRTFEISVAVNMWAAHSRGPDPLHPCYSVLVWETTSGEPRDWPNNGNGYPTITAARDAAVDQVARVLALADRLRTAEGLRA